MAEQGSWENYSKLVLQQLETLTKSIDVLREELQDMKSQLTELKAKEDRIHDIKAWKERIDDVASPMQLRDAFVDIEELKEFKTKAITVFMVVQFLMAIMVGFAKFW